jgi:fimbrial chaperone protein
MRVVTHGLTGLAAAILALLCGMLPAGAMAFQVQPVRLELPAERAQGVLTVRNTTDAPLLLQAEVFTWRQAEGSDELTPTRDVLVNPPIFEIAPGASQLVRVGLRPGASQSAGRESTYRVWLTQLPRTREPTDNAGAAGNASSSSGVTILFRMNLPLFVTPRAARPAEAVWQRDADALRASNPGARHLSLREIVLTRPDGVTLKLPHRTVLAGAEARWALPPDWRDAVFVVSVTDEGGTRRASPSVAGR